MYNNVYAGGIAINVGNMQYICIGPLQRLVLVNTICAPVVVYLQRGSTGTQTVNQSDHFPY